MDNGVYKKIEVDATDPSAMATVNNLLTQVQMIYERKRETTAQVVRGFDPDDPKIFAVWFNAQAEADCFGLVRDFTIRHARWPNGAPASQYLIGEPKEEQL